MEDLKSYAKPRKQNKQNRLKAERTLVELILGLCSLKFFSFFHKCDKLVLGGRENLT